MDRFLDLRFIIGLFFLLTGLALLLYGVTHTEGSGINTGCGVLFIAFGALMALLSPKANK